MIDGRLVGDRVIELNVDVWPSLSEYQCAGVRCYLQLLAVSLRERASEKMSRTRSSTSVVRSDRRFATTNWSMVLAAGRAGGDDQGALAQLCATYWYPLYAYVRRRGYQAAQAQDLTQDFFATVLEKDTIKAADPQRGRFRSFLLASLDHYLANRRCEARAQKRGGGSVVSMDFQSAEDKYAAECADQFTPAQIFERRWALALLDQAFDQLHQDYRASGKERLFEHLQGYLGGGNPAVPYRDAGTNLGMTEAAVKVAVHRLRRRFREILRGKIAETVTDPEHVDDELRALFNAVGR